MEGGCLVVWPVSETSSNSLSGKSSGCSHSGTIFRRQAANAAVVCFNHRSHSFLGKWEHFPALLVFDFELSPAAWQIHRKLDQAFVLSDFTDDFSGVE